MANKYNMSITMYTTNIKKGLCIAVATLSLLLLSAGQVKAQDENIEFMPEEMQMQELSVPSEFARAKIDAIQTNEEGFASTITFTFVEGPRKGQQINMQYGGFFTIQGDPTLHPGGQIIVGTGTNGTEESHTIIDKYRFPSIALITLIFLVLAIFFGRKRGVTSIIGLVLTVIVLVYGIIPAIVGGSDPLIVSIGGAVVIAVISLYVAHGFNKRTTIALISLLLTLGLAVILALLFASITSLTGAASSDAYFLQFGSAAHVNLHGLLLGGIIIGALGVLDDITTGQVAAVEEIHKADRTLPLIELYKRGLSVGREHIASLVNTLVLAYAGASFPLFLILSDQTLQPLWVTLNQEFIVEEIVRTLVGSSALILAVPITTMLAARAFTRMHHHTAET